MAGWIVRQFLLIAVVVVVVGESLEARGGVSSAAPVAAADSPASVLSAPGGDTPPIPVSPAEWQNVEERLRAFYSTPRDPRPMNERVPKYHVGRGEFINPNPELRLDFDPENPLLRLAGVKGTEKYWKWYCENFLERRFESISCDATWSTAEANDTLEGLTDTWIARDKLVYELDGIPTSGKSTMPLWSDDYWRTQWGGISFRYLEKKAFGHYREAISDYAQPLNWFLVGGNPAKSLVTDTVKRWSPAEKYDLTVGDEKFSLTMQQKKDGESSMGSGGNVEPWIGLCHGWAPAAMLVARPMKPVTVKAKNGQAITWLPQDIRALTTLAWGTGTTKNNYAGSRCRPTNPKTYSNGRIMDQDCFDTNPATFHLALGNLIGIHKLSFVMDKQYDYEVWNQPISSYDFVYFNPLDPSQKSTNWKEVAVNYDARFKAQDRFQRPLTRGVSGPRPDDSRVRKVVGVIASVSYLGEVFPRSEELANDEFHRVQFMYDLELESDGGSRLIPRGGEWHHNGHPDFLWLPQKGQIASAKYDKPGLTYATDKAPAKELTETAQTASGAGYPLCQVVRELVKKSANGEVKYECPKPPTETPAQPTSPAMTPAVAPPPTP